MQKALRMGLLLLLQLCTTFILVQALFMTNPRCVALCQMYKSSFVVSVSVHWNSYVLGTVPAEVPRSAAKAWYPHWLLPASLPAWLVSFGTFALWSTGKAMNHCCSRQ